MYCHLIFCSSAIYLGNDFRHNGKTATSFHMKFVPKIKTVNSGTCYILFSEMTTKVARMAIKTEAP
jgi:hypothetical protein